MRTYFFEALESHGVLAQIDTLFLLELFHEVVHQLNRRE